VLTGSAFENVDLDRFLEASALLTGFTVGELRATGLVERYYAVCSTLVERRHLAVSLRAVVTAGGPAASDDPVVKELACALVHLWYHGVWSGLRAQVSEASRAEGAPFVVSPHAYAEGLVWKTFHGTPPGAVAPGFGSWAHPPRVVSL
jgi:hypothetical protein